MPKADHKLSTSRAPSRMTRATSKPNPRARKKATATNVAVKARTGRGANAAPRPRAKLDWPGALRRVQLIVDLLRNGYHGEGERRWKLDERITEKALAYYAAKARDPNANPRGDKYDAVIALIAGTGQSLEWVWGGDPSLMILELAERAFRSRARRRPGEWPLQLHPRRGKQSRA